MTQISLNKKVVIVIVALLASILLVGCNSSSNPSSLTEKWFNAIIKKDIETVAKFLYVPDFFYPEEIAKSLISFLEEEGSIWSFEIKGETMSANGESAIVTVYVITEECIRRGGSGEEWRLFWIKQNNVWRIDVERIGDLN